MKNTNPSQLQQRNDAQCLLEQFKTSRNDFNVHKARNDDDNYTLKETNHISNLLLEQSDPAQNKETDVSTIPSASVVLDRRPSRQAKTVKRFTIKWKKKKNKEMKKGESKTKKSYHKQIDNQEILKETNNISNILEKNYYQQ